MTRKITSLEEKLARGEAIQRTCGHIVAQDHSLDDMPDGPYYDDCGCPIEPCCPGCGGKWPGTACVCNSCGWIPPDIPGQHECDVCRQPPRESGAQYDMACIIWDGVRTHVCSNCVHASPVSITELHKAVDRITAQARLDPAPF